MFPASDKVPALLAHLVIALYEAEALPLWWARMLEVCRYLPGRHLAT